MRMGKTCTVLMEGGGAEFLVFLLRRPARGRVFWFSFLAVGQCPSISCLRANSETLADLL